VTCAGKSGAAGLGHGKKISQERNANRKPDESIAYCIDECDGLSHSTAHHPAHQSGCAALLQATITLSRVIHERKQAGKPSPARRPPTPAAARRSSSLAPLTLAVFIAFLTIGLQLPVLPLHLKDAWA
jgi:hypothetical protein